MPTQPGPPFLSFQACLCSDWVRGHCLGFWALSHYPLFSSLIQYIVPNNFCLPFLALCYSVLNKHWQNLLEIIECIVFLIGLSFFFWVSHDTYLFLRVYKYWKSSEHLESEVLTVDCIFGVSVTILLPCRLAVGTQERLRIRLNMILPDSENN